jgi:hypothetical protein
MKKAKFIIGLILLLAVVIINSCENKQAALPPVKAAVSNCDTIKLTYSSDSNTMQAIINVQCGVSSSNTSCHSTSGTGGYAGYDFTTYSGIYAQYQNGNLLAALFGNGNSVPQMPLVQQPGWDPCILSKFKAWIDLGCPQ